MSDKYLHVLLITASALHKKKCRQQFQLMNLTEGQPKVLSVLRAMEGCLQKELAKACRVEAATMTSILKNMEKSELIYKEPELVSGGKRAYSIHFTEKGKAMALEVNRIVGELESICFDDFSEKEKEEFLSAFSKIVDNLEKSDARELEGIGE